MIDLARMSPFQSGVVVADSALHTRQTSKSELQSVLTTCSRWRGSHQAGQVVEFCDARSESALESISRVAFRDYGLPQPDLQVWVGHDHDGVVIGRVDFLWRAHRTIAEADGAVKYANPSRAICQLQRDADLRQAGFEVAHFTWRQIVTTPWQVAASIRSAFERGDAARLQA